MWFCGFSLDNLSLMALTIGTGFVVDDAIVMIENIVRHMENGDKPMQAALDGAREIGFTVISLTLSLIAVFIPLLFMTGLVGRMFREFALTLTIAVVDLGHRVADADADDVRPAPEAARASAKEPAVSRGFSWAIDGIVELYRSTLEWVLRASAGDAARHLPDARHHGLALHHRTEGLPADQDTGLVTAVLEAEPQVSFTELSNVQQQVADAVEEDPAVAGVVAVAGVGTLNTTPNVANLKITLKPRDERSELVGPIIER